LFDEHKRIEAKQTQKCEPFSSVFILLTVE